MSSRRSDWTTVGRSLRRPAHGSGVILERTAFPYSLLAGAACYRAVQSVLRRPSARRRFVRERIAPWPGCRVLDLGCGTGDLIPFLPACEYVGIDGNGAYLRTARRLFSKGADFREFDLAALTPGGLGSFDVIVALGVLHHLDDATATRMLAFAFGSLSPLGRFVSHDPVFATEQSALSRWLVARDRGRHVRTHETMLGLVGAAFPHVEASIVNGNLRVPYTEIEIVARPGHEANGVRVGERSESCAC